MPDHPPPAPPRRDLAGLLLAERRQFAAFLQGRVGDRELAEDLLQDALAKAIERADTVRDEEAVVAWFYRLLRNAVVDHARRSDAAARRLAQYAQTLDASAEPDPQHTAEVCRCLRALVSGLKPEYAAALELVDLGGQSVQAYAEEVGITPTNASVRLHRARKALRRELLSFCRLCAEHGCLDCSCRGEEGTVEPHGAVPR